MITIVNSSDDNIKLNNYLEARSHLLSLFRTLQQTGIQFTLKPIPPITAFREMDIFYDDEVGDYEAEDLAEDYANDPCLLWTFSSKYLHITLDYEKLSEASEGFQLILYMRVPILNSAITSSEAIVLSKAYDDLTANITWKLENRENTSIIKTQQSITFERLSYAEGNYNIYTWENLPEGDYSLQFVMNE